MIQNNTSYENYHEEKRHTSTFFPYNTYLCTIPLDFKNVALHWHDDAEIIYIKKGHGIVSVDLKNYHVNAGDIVFIMPGQLHSIDSFNNERMEYENIIFEMDFLSSRLPERIYTEYFNPLMEGKLDFPVLISPDTLEKYADAAHFLDMADACCRDKLPAYEIAVKGYLFCFFSTLFSNCKGKNTDYTADTNLDKLKSIIKYVERHYQENITIEEMAKLCCFSTSHFMRFFKNKMNQTFTSYLINYRITKAASLLTGTDSNILDIAQETGFDNLSYFNRTFKKIYNMTPKEYRKINL